ncbi:uncharacterized protein GGS22DRAFT_185478 [Annulohypoxylon maeteangense]|uniref:uncharacterized protein n=1 Tax=Annulohypoxylon maeteangense TaxID=1927788 RepID=UPI002007415A|nr:uncharacterized protein GGS22DRAFT_185478 [Annulohypoxylon maeteangense]KAI0888098.1 hypothetical protein GGS22DRAFT_185478 [Annulohypoxylon maeteangense]
MEIPGQDKVPPRHLEEVKRVKGYFNNTNKPSFKFRKIIGTGARGFAVEMGMEDDSSESPKRPSLINPLFGIPRPPTGPLPSFFDPLPPSFDRPLFGQSLFRPSFGGNSFDGPSSFVSPFNRLPSNDPPIELERLERFVMKRAFERKDDETIVREIEVLRRLQGAQNIQQLYHLPDAEESLKLEYLPGPTLFTEWIPNGQIRDLIMTRPEWGHPLPNRMLWRCFLCMCHMLIAMAWPPDGNLDAHSARPELPPMDPSGVRPQKSTLRHNDINIGNIMFGDFDLTAHRSVPILKLIDFGQASYSAPPFIYTEEAAVRQNMARIAEVMINLIGGTVNMTMRGSANMEVTTNGQTQVIRSRAKDLDGLDRRYGADNATMQRHMEWVGNLDIDLRNLLVRCLATDEAMRPGLEDLYEEVLRNVTEKTRASYAGKRWQDNESDESLRRISKALIINRQQ